MLCRLDAVERAIEREISQYRAESFPAFLTVEVSIRRSHLKLPTVTTSDRIESYILQVFGQPEERVEARLGSHRVHVMRECHALTTVRNIMSSAPRHPNPVEEYDVPIELRRTRAWEAQRRWWAINGQTFALLQLPRELRDLIYAQLHASRVHPFHVHKSMHGTGMAAASLLASMRTSRQVYQEITQHISAHYRFRFWQTFALRRALQEPCLMQSMRHLCLAFQPQQYLLIFGIVFDGTEHLLEPDPIAQRLRRLTLTSLSISIKYPGSHACSARGSGDICCECARPLLIQAVWPYVRGHSCSLMEGFTVRERRSFAWQAVLARSEYLDWKAKAAALGLDVTLDAWDKWATVFELDDGGGVPLLGDVHGEESDEGDEVSDENETMQRSCAQQCIGRLMLSKSEAE